MTIAAIRAALEARVPRTLTARRRAAVAIVLHDVGPDPALLFIERAARLGDPWSGQMAFPGGRIDPGDADARAAAERETREEVGLDLAAAECLGRLDEVDAGVRLVAPLALSAFVYRTAAVDALVPNHEVREAIWVPVSRLRDPGAHVDHRFGLVRFPGILVGVPGRHVVWGLTYELVTDLFRTAGMPLRA